jgi:hypothetical protein
VGSGPVSLNTWTHVALVRDGGVARLYVNGVAAGASAANNPATPTGFFGIDAPPQGNSTQVFQGLIDEVRVFTFAPGLFSTNDLLLNALILTKLEDSGPGKLRSALQNARSNDVVWLPFSGTITLSNALPLLTNALTIRGPGAANLTISGANSNRIFFVDASNQPVLIRDLTLANGRAKGGNGGVGMQGGGGGLGAGGPCSSTRGQSPSRTSS